MKQIANAAAQKAVSNSRNQRRNSKRERSSNNSAYAGGMISGRTVGAPTSVAVRMENRNVQSSLPIRKTELVGTVNGTVDFTVAGGTGSAINILRVISPSNPTLFNWLSKISNNFEFVEWKRLSFRFVPRVGTQTAGQIYMAFDYDPTDDAPSTAQDIMNYQGAVTDSVWKEIVCHASSRELYRLKRYFTRLAEQRDPALHYPAEIFIATEGMASTAIVGQLFVDYDCVLTVPQVAPAVTDELNASVLAVNPTPQMAVGSPVNVTNIIPPSNSVVSAVTALKNLRPSVVNGNAWEIVRTGNYLMNVAAQLGLAPDATANTFLDCFEDVVQNALNPMVDPATIGSPSNLVGATDNIQITVGDPDLTGALQVTSRDISPSNNVNNAQFALCNIVPTGGSNTQQYFNYAKSYEMGFDETLIGPGQRRPWFNFSLTTPTLFKDSSQLGTVPAPTATNVDYPPQTATIGSLWGVKQADMVMTVLGNLNAASI